MSDDAAALILALPTEIAELRVALAEAQELLIETAVDAGEMHARLEEVQRKLAVARAERFDDPGKAASIMTPATVIASSQRMT